VRAPRLIHTARLELSPPSAEDAEDVLARYAGDLAVTRYVGWPRHQSLADTRAFLAFSDDHWARWPAGPYLIRTRSDGQLIGGTGLTFEVPDEAMTGYVLARDAWGHGYATEALGAMVDVARTLGLRRLYALCHPDHRASSHVLEKGGFARDAAWTGRVAFPNLAAGLQDAWRYERLVEGIPVQR